VADYIFVNLGASTQVGAGSAHLDLKQDILDMRGSYRVLDTRPGSSRSPERFQVMLDMGARFWSLNPTLTLKLDPLLPTGMGHEAGFAGKTSWWSARECRWRWA
jgi:hypothetical protein